MSTVAVIAVFLFGCASPKPLEILGQVPEFQLVSQTGQPFDSKSLDGHVWVADFMYTSCPGPCPMMTSQMHRLQAQTADISDLKLVSFTVDPAHDTPTVLAAYGKQFKYDPARWIFLTGDQFRLNDLGRNAFQLNSVDGSLQHSTRFVLVDRHRRIRGYYLSSEPGFLSNLEHDIRQLERQSS